ncbi:MAG: hypothetical protein VX939_00285 [Pseudomonadota bacterium]|nr:hypothetical protein [Pseudomonadota bacterium]
MLKELWRKFESDFLQADCAAQDAIQSAEGSDGFRLMPHITHTGEFHLERLTHLLKSRYGKNLALPGDEPTSDQALKDIITFAARIQDQDVQRELLLFYLNCSPVIQEYLRSETALGQGSFVR